MSLSDFTVTEVRFAFERAYEHGHRLSMERRNGNGLTMVLSGKLTFTYPDATYVVGAGEIFLQRNLDRYGIIASASERTEFIVITYLAEPEDALWSLLPSRVFCTAHPSRFRASFESAVRIHASAGVCFRPLLRAIVQEMICGIIRENYPSMLSRERNPVEYAKRYMDEFFGARLSVEQIASTVGVSSSYLRALFHQSEGESPNRYLNRVRVERAKEMLASGMFSLQEIASECGFQNVYYFSRVFKAYTGISPGKY